MIKVSIIIPVYGVEKYIRQCIESVLNQTYKNIEVIVVNDGTKDNSMKIIEEYIRDNRIKIINKENGGLSSARNRGIEEATGKYIFFVDSDDWLENNTIEELINNLEDEEILECNFFIYDEITNIKERNKLKISNYEVHKEKQFYEPLEMVVWNKLYNRKFLNDNNIRFLEGVIHEDVEFTIKTFVKVKKVKYINEYVYNYRINRKNSIMYKVKKKEYKEQSKESLKEIVKNLEDIYKTFSENKKLLLKINRLKIEIFKLEEKKIERRNRINLDQFLDKEYLKSETYRNDLRDMIYQRKYTKFSCGNYLYWKYGILNLKIIRKYIGRLFKNR